MRAILLCALCFALNYGSGVSQIVLENGVSDEDIKIIVDTHNEMRLLVAQGKLRNQPRGRNLKRMEWDDQLAREAQKIADLMKFEHQAVKDRRFYVGQNIHISMSTIREKGATWKKAIGSWFDEYKVYRYPRDPAHETGHYTQIVAANSSYIGCGFSSFKTSGNFPFNRLNVCNYGPGGNILGRPPYLVGKGCVNLC